MKSLIAVSSRYGVFEFPFFKDQGPTRSLTGTKYGTLAYAGYLVLIGIEWRWINPYEPLLPQITGMRGYALVDERGIVVRQSTVNPSYE